MQVSADLLARAWRLGQKMAAAEARIVPDLSGARRCRRYVTFRELHRQRMEANPAFHEWGARLEQLLEHASRKGRAAFDDPTVWLRYSEQLAASVQDAFWIGWEQAHHLERLYREHVTVPTPPGPEATSVPAAGAAAAGATVLTLRPVVEPARAKSEGADVPLTFWDAIAKKVFDELGVDDSGVFWSLPDPNQLCAKGTSRPAANNPSA